MMYIKTIVLPPTHLTTDSIKILSQKIQTAVRVTVERYCETGIVETTLETK